MTAHPPVSGDDPRWAITDPLVAAGLIHPDRPHYVTATHRAAPGRVVSNRELSLIGTPLEDTLPEDLRDEIARLRNAAASG